MCWPHVYRNVVPKLAHIKKVDGKVHDQLLEDIESLQWAANNEDTFRNAYDLLEIKYRNKFKDYSHVLDDFFSYFRQQWVESPVFRWYEGSHPWGVNNNQGIEGLNKQIKKSHTFKRRCPLANFMDIVSRMVQEWSKEEEVLSLSRKEMLFNPRDGLKLRTDGYQWLKSIKSASDQIICVKPGSKYTVSGQFDLGIVNNLWVVGSSCNKIVGSLKQRAKERIKQRGSPSFASFDNFLEVRQSCWILEERNDEFYCDCPVGMKGKQCKHEVGLMFKNGHLEVTSEVRSVPINQKRKRGRPKKLPHCLSKSPVRISSSSPPSAAPDCPMLNVSAVQVTPEASVTRKRAVEDDIPDMSPVAAFVTQATDSLGPGLGMSKPPKKKARGEAIQADILGVSKPVPIKCRKRKASCKHEIVFNEHYDKKAWSVYAKFVSNLKSSTPPY